MNERRRWIIPSEAFSLFLREERNECITVASTDIQDDTDEIKWLTVFALTTRTEPLPNKTVMGANKASDLLIA